jgi:hypothetical protein
MKFKGMNRVRPKSTANIGIDRDRHLDPQDAPAIAVLGLVAGSLVAR